MYGLISPGWVVEQIKFQHINTSTVRPLIGSSYIKLPAELRNPKKRGPINIKNNNQKCFLWGHIRHINSVKIYAERITQKDKKLINDLNYKVIKFPVSKNYFSKIQMKKNICINVFCYENKLTFPVQLSDQKFENLMDLLLIFDGDYIKDFFRFLFQKTKNKNKKYFCKSCIECFSSRNVLTEHKRTLFKNK